MPGKVGRALFGVMGHPADREQRNERKSWALTFLWSQISSEQVDAFLLRSDLMARKQEAHL